MLINYNTNNTINKLLNNFNNNCNIKYIYNSDFSNGTYIIDEPGFYELKENIIFNPNVDNKGKPYEYQRLNGPYSDNNYIFGFFCCIHINCSNVYLNLNGKSIEMSKFFRLFNRFGSIISITDNLFNKFQGPSGKLLFKEVNNKFNNINIIGSIYNNIKGKLFNTPHHGIRANKINGLKLYNLDIYNFEVSGISLNGCSNIFLNNILVHDTIKDTVVNDRFSQLIIITEQLKSIYKIIDNILFETYANTYTLKEIIEINDNYINQVYESYIKNIEYNGLFKNVNKIPIGQVFGISISSNGVIIGDFKTDIPDTYISKNIVLDNVKIYNLITNPISINTIEFVCNNNVSNNNVSNIGCPCSHDTNNDKFKKLTSGTGDMYNIDIDLYDPLNLSQCFIMYISNVYKNVNDIKNIVRNSNFCLEFHNNCVLNNNNIYSILDNCNIRLSDPNIKIDSMNHNLKANMGLFIQQSENILLNNISIDNIYNFKEFDKTYGIQLISSNNIFINMNILNNITNINGNNNSIIKNYNFEFNKTEPITINSNLY